MKKTHRIYAGIMAAVLAIVGFAGCKNPADKHPADTGGKDKINPLRVRERPLMAGYYRTWHDKQSDPSWKWHNPKTNKDVPAPHEMTDLPKEVDVVFVFHDWTKEDSPFWKTLKEQYVPKLNAQGTQVVRTIGFEFLIGTKGILKDEYPSATPADYPAMAKRLVDEYVYRHNMNGLDIDIERHNFSGNVQRGIALLKEVAKCIGPRGKDKSKLFIVDTNFTENNQAISELKEDIDLLLIQAYRQEAPSLENHWSNVKAYIAPKKFMIGFSFYEENCNNQWGDIRGATKNSVDNTRAKRFAEWQPKDGSKKGGIFSYAIERDGILDGDNTKFPEEKSTYTWTKLLKSIAIEKHR